MFVNGLCFSTFFSINQKRSHCLKEIQNHVASGHNKLPIQFGCCMLLFNASYERTREHGEHAETDFLRPRVHRPPRPPRAVLFRKSTSGNGRRPRRPRRVVRLGAEPYGAAAFNGDTWSRVLVVGRRFLAARSLAADQNASLSTC